MTEHEGAYSFAVVLIDIECPTATPEPHLLGEFPMSCYACHMEADS